MKKGKWIFLLALIISLVACKAGDEKSAEYKPVHPEWSYNATIYELNIRQYSEEGSFNAVTDDLERIKSLGIDIIWLMPIHPIGEKNRKGTLGSYYAVKDYKAVNPEFGTLADFKGLVKKAHDLGMYVIIDWVANHTAWDNVWLKDHPDFFSRDSLGNVYPPVADWEDVIDLNYDNMELRKFMQDAMAYWVKDCDIDGFRCDVAAMVPTDFWEAARKKLDSIKPVFMLAEAHEPELHPSFDMTYNWQLKDAVNSIAKKEMNVVELIEHFAKEDSAYQPDDFRMTFITNHDENTWNGTAQERLGDGLKAFYTLVATVKGMPLLYSGQESGVSNALEFFEKDAIDWNGYPETDFYKTLLELKKYEALYNGNRGGEMIYAKTSQPENVLAFTREKGKSKILVVLNLSDKEQKVTIEGENLKGSYFEVFKKEVPEITDKMVMKLKPWDYYVFVELFE